MIVEVNDYMR